MRKKFAKEKWGLSSWNGSNNLPRFIVIEYNGATKYSKVKKKIVKTIALVGKGVTFDSGGISINPIKIWEMKVICQSSCCCWDYLSSC
jgi:leucyl aminopeptidase